VLKVGYFVVMYVYTDVSEESFASIIKVEEIPCMLNLKLLRGLFRNERNSVVCSHGSDLPRPRLTAYLIKPHHRPKFFSIYLENINTVVKTEAAFSSKTSVSTSKTIKVKFALGQTAKAQKGSRGIALPFL
jgi:hypothetical protein